ncbi:adenine methyltransferase [Haloarcula sinaiiensis tailed virus 1]|uniref:site-specific DNA-methyltransferase (cytosine-N(4)-specific) n=1 Tax=Haloarcula sinaiiensis tailed virus 1 TaxID=1262530 RepID=R9QST6_9CAUD|nr:DNA methyltransferase [Haloarcula sinaiiensis tailed virus 1]AGC34596.1 adenine methyltransferase [Haloarcula sinaiiensis tailed virus 1]
MSEQSLADLPQPDYEGTVDADALHTDGDNPNEMTDEQFGLLCDRMRQNGWLGGPIVTDTDGLIADGEHRWRAAQEIGLSEVPVRQFDIDDATRRLWRQELNKIHGEHDSKRDALEYDELLSSGYSEEVEALTDAADEDLDELLAEIRVDTSRPAAYEYDPDHSVYFEDCVEGMAERLDDDSVDMVFTSPPYNVDLDRDDRESGMVSYSDALSDSEYFQFIRDVLVELDRVVKPGGHIFINHQNDIRGGKLNPQHWIIEAMPTPLRSYIIWNKGDYAPTSVAGLNSDGQYYPSWEPVFHFSDSPSPLNGTKNYSVWDVSPIAGNERQEAGEHPAPYPLSLAEKAIQSATDEGDRILDPFMGSGTTAVAAIQNDRDYVGFELDEEGAYKPIIERRIGEAKRQAQAEVNADD